MAVAYDAYAGLVAATSTASPFSWTHTPSGTPRGVIVEVEIQGGSIETVSVTYGGVAMTALTVVDGTGAAEPHSVYPFILGASVPTGAQTVQVTRSGSQPARGDSWTVTASADTELADQDQLVSSSQDDPSITLTSAREAVAVSALCSGLGNASNVTAGSGFTKDRGAATGGGSSFNVEHLTSATGGGGNITCAWTTSAADDAIMSAVAIQETGTTTITPAALTHTRAIPAPTVSPEVLPAALTHVRAIPAPVVSTPASGVGILRLWSRALRRPRV